MITNLDQAKELCVRFDIKLSEHDTVIVTGNNSIYLSDNIDPADTSEKFFLKGGKKSIVTEKAKEPLEYKIEENIQEETEKAKDKKSKK